MKSGRSKSSPASGPAATSPTKLGRPTRDAQLATRGARVLELKQKLEDFKADLHSHVYAATRKHATDPDSILSVQAVLSKAVVESQQNYLDRVREYVEEADVTPVHTKYLGRALHDIGAVDASHATKRSEIFAHLSDSPRCKVIHSQPGKTDYFAVAEACYQHHTTGSDIPAHLSGCASTGLQTAVEKLETLHLSDSESTCVKPHLSKTGKKRSGSYLTAIGCEVFQDWPEWPR